MNADVAHRMFRDHLKKKNYSASSVDRYCREVRDFLLHQRKRDVREITKDDLLGYRGYLADCGRFGSSSQRGMVSALRIFFRWLYRQELILSDPFDNLDLGSVKREHKKSSVPADILGRILDSIDGTKHGDLRDRAIFELMYGCGLRVGETAALNLTDVDWKTGRVFIHEGKGRRDRIVPAGNHALAMVKRYVDYGRSYLEEVKNRDALFLSGKGNRVSVQSIQTSLRKRAGEIYPDLKIHPHMLRHSFATHMLEAGAPIKQIKDILGHRSMETTVAYTHFNAAGMRKILKMYHPRENELYEEFDEEDYMKFVDKKGE